MQSQPPVRQKIIREIKPSPVLQARTKNHKLRVAAYCRVSTEQEEQQTSIENQITYYEDLIRSNPEWEYAGVFSDDGISGTRDENRPGFMEMIKQCKKGKIDMILAKSLSRFSRNTLQCISYIRMLKDRGIIIICSIISVLLNEWFVLILTVLANPERKVRKSLFFLLGFWVYGIYLLATIIFSFLMSSGFTWIGAVLINLLYLLFLVKVFQIWKERCLIDQDYEPSER